MRQLVQLLQQQRHPLLDKAAALRHLGGSSRRSFLDPGCRGLSSSPVVAFNKNLRESGHAITGHDYNYEDLVKDFKWHVPEYFNYSRDVIEKFAWMMPDRLALWFVHPDGKETQLTYSQLNTASQAAANVLASLGVKSAMCILTRLPDWWLINLAAIRQGVVLLPGAAQLQEKDIAWRLKASQADCIFAGPDTAVKVDAVLKEQANPKLVKVVVGGEMEGWLSWSDLIAQADTKHTAVKTHKDEVMQIFFTSGTTGSPKMVPHTHGSYGYCHYVTGKYWLDLTPEDTHWNISDTGWAKSAWSSLFGPFFQGCTVFVHGMPRYVATDVLDTLTKYPITTMCAPPTLYRSLVQEKVKNYKMKHLRHCVSAGEPLNEEVIYNWEEATGIVIKEGYGQTESTLLCGTFKKMNKWVKPGSIGKAAPGYDVRIVNNMGKEVPRGEQGNIGVRVKPIPPPGLFKGYLGDEEATSHAFCDDFYLTGDRATQDEDGYFWFQSRTDDLIISSGYRIGPFEVESALLEHPAVEESAVVASPDVDRGQVVKAFIVLARSHHKIKGRPVEEMALMTELQDHVKSTTAPYKYPRKIEFVESLPKTVSGKIRRTMLREGEIKKSKQSKQKS